MKKKKKEDNPSHEHSLSPWVAGRTQGEKGGVGNVGDQSRCIANACK